MFSVGNLYLVPTINGEVKYQPKAQARFFIRNCELDWGRPVCNTSNFYIIEENSNSHQLASSYFHKEEQAD